VIRQTSDARINCDQPEFLTHSYGPNIRDPRSSGSEFAEYCCQHWFSRIFVQNALLRPAFQKQVISEHAISQKWSPKNNDLPSLN
jgi:hypothetical protein